MKDIEFERRKTPVSPAELIGALHDRVHFDEGSKKRVPTTRIKMNRQEEIAEVYRLNLERPIGTKVLVDGSETKIIGKHIRSVNGIVVKVYGFGMPVAIERIGIK
jgi:hypothetical protein